MTARGDSFTSTPRDKSSAARAIHPCSKWLSSIAAGCYPAQIPEGLEPRYRVLRIRVGLRDSAEVLHSAHHPVHPQVRAPDLRPAARKIRPRPRPIRMRHRNRPISQRIRHRRIRRRRLQELVAESERASEARVRVGKVPLGHSTVSPEIRQTCRSPQARSMDQSSVHS